jgi:hypothetical protein
MPLDGQGIWQYTGPELAAPAPALLNRLAASTSTQVAALRETTVRSFASAAARTAAVPAPKEGAVTWLEDVNHLEVYSGSSWLVAAAPQDGRVVSGSTNGSGLLTFPHLLGRTPTWCTATMANSGTDSLNLLMTPVVFTLGPTTISIAIRREDTHAWFLNQPVVVYVNYGLSIGAL